jgi:hypothetical protein
MNHRIIAWGYTNDTYKRLPDHAGRHRYQPPDPNEILGDRLPDFAIREILR